ncbi:MAG: hypothetical protein VW405_07170 [Rhodospirillaceae bacterium]
MSVAREVAEGQLVPVGGAPETVELEIRLYRARPRPMIDRIWNAIDEIGPLALPVMQNLHN